MNDDFFTKRLDYLRGLKAPSEHQQILLLLADNTQRTATENRKLAVLVKAEKAAERALKARGDAARVVNAEKEIARKARDRELYKAAGLLILAGLVDSKLGAPVIDSGELLGALLELSKVPSDDPRRAEWKRAGDARMAEKAKKAKA